MSAWIYKNVEGYLYVKLQMVHINWDMFNVFFTTYDMLMYVGSSSYFFIKGYPDINELISMSYQKVVI